MTPSLQADIENYLLDHPTWIPIRHLVKQFNLPSERDLRAYGRTPGPLSFCAIFSDKGVKHIRHATPQEIRQCRHRIRRELISRARRDRWLKIAITRCLNHTQSPKPELHTGQLTFFA